MGTQKQKKLQCPKCGGGQIQTRMGDKKRWCRKCLYEAPMLEFDGQVKAA